MAYGHIYMVNEQPATRFADDIGGKRIWFRNPSHLAIKCGVCQEYHQARNMVVQVYYDLIRFRCKRGFAGGCRSGR